MNYYNDNDKHACAWLRELIKAKLIPEGEVDGRSITEVRAEELSRFHQCHFFAGIGGWSYALQLAGWQDPCWTGSCPCQPFSTAGKKQGEADPRHLWPAFRALIAQSKPPVIFGEQVASKAGREWLAGVRADLEGLGYVVGAADLCAAGVGAPHKRQRLYWVGYSGGVRCLKHQKRNSESEVDSPYRNTRWDDLNGLRGNGRMAHAADGGTGRSESSVTGRDRQKDGIPWSDSISIICRDGKSRRIPPEPSLFPLAYGVSGRVGLLRGAGNSIVPQVAAEFVKAFMECT